MPRFQFCLRSIFWATAAIGAGCLVLPWVAPIAIPLIGWLWLPLYVIAGIGFALLPFPEQGKTWQAKATPARRSPDRPLADEAETPGAVRSFLRRLTLVEWVVIVSIVLVLAALLAPDVDDGVRSVRQRMLGKNAAGQAP